MPPHSTWQACSEPPDLLLIPGGPALPGLAPDAALCDWLREVGMRCRRLASVCNGAFLLAHAGLLDGLHVTTHWNDASKLAARFPSVKVEPDRIFLRQGHIYTSAGVTAGIDLALHLVREDWVAKCRSMWRSAWWCSASALAGNHCSALTWRPISTTGRRSKQCSNTYAPISRKTWAWSVWPRWRR